MAATTRKKPPAPATPPPQDRRAASQWLEAVRTNPPGQWSADRAAQVRHFTETCYIAISAVMDAYGGATAQVMCRKRRDRARATFGPGPTVAKALPGGHAQARDEEYTPLDDDGHPLARLVTYPNEHQSFAEMLSYLVMQLLLTGQQYVWALPNAAGKPVGESYALPSAAVFPNTLPGQTANYPRGSYKVQPGQAGGWAFAGGRLAATTILPGEEVKTLYKPHPYLLWTGYSPLEACATALDILEAIAKSRWAAMEHGPQLDAVLMLSGMNDPEQIKDIHAKLTKAHGGARNSRKLGVIGLPPGQSAQGALQNFGNNVRELDYSGSWSQMAEFVLAVFGVPKDVAGLEEAGSYSKLYANMRQFFHRQSNGMKQQSEFFSRNYAQPWSSFPGEYKIQIDLPKPEDPELAEQQHGTDVGAGAITVNELRGLRGRPPVEGGDVPPKVYEQVMMQKMAPQPGAPGQPGADDEAQQGDPLEALLGGGDGGAGKPLPGGTPTGGGPPRPGNAAAAGTGVPRPTVGKAAAGMGELAGGAGGFLVPAGATKVKKKKRARAALAKVLSKYRC